MIGIDENGIEWYIVGSAGDALRGVGVKPFDIDIVVHELLQGKRYMSSEFSRFNNCAFHGM